MVRPRSLSALMFILVASASAEAESFNAGYSSGWMTQIGLTASVEMTASQGSGAVIGAIDTGVVSSVRELRGRVLAASACAGVDFTCTQGVADDNGHGTATASIAAGSTALGGAISGVAPKASVVGEKVLDSTAHGCPQDVAKGIAQAVAAGATVLNLSLTFEATGSMIAAVNDATSKGAILVFAGGNSTLPFNGGIPTVGLTSAALTHLVFVGSVDSKNALSTFSDTPGAGLASAGTVSASYASLWLMAPGENVVAPSVTLGSNAYSLFTGTSMAAPMVTGALALLQQTWPVLARNGTATAVLFQAATDLGTAGVDQTYGNGLLNVAKAFQPVGTLTVARANGTAIPVSQLTGAMLVGGALGAAPGLAAGLSRVTALDSYQRNFTVNLSSLLQRKPAPTISAARIAPISDTVGGIGQPLPQNSVSFANVLWGDDFAGGRRALGGGVSNALLDLAEDVPSVVVGSRLGARSRIAFLLSMPGEAAIERAAGPWRGASAMGIGVTTELAEGWRGGATFGLLNERNALLGTRYGSAGSLGLGGRHDSMSVGVSTSFNLDGRTGLTFDALLAASDRASVADGLVASVSSVLSRAVGVTVTREEAFATGDRLALSLKKPLRVIAGSAAMVATTVDAQGFASIGATRVSLRPAGDETDLALAYRLPLGRGTDLSAGASLDNDAENLPGNKAALANIGVTFRF